MRGRSWQRGAVLALAICALAPRAAAASAYYVNDSATEGDRPFPGCAAMGPGASAAPCGTCARPCDSPQLAYDANPVGPGDVLYLNAGRYSPDAGAPGLALTTAGKNGRAGAPLVVEGLVDPSGRCARDDAGVPLVLVDGQGTGSVGVFLTVSFVTLKGFGITNMAPAGIEPFGSGVRIVDSPGAPDAGVDGFVVTGMDIYGLSGGFASPVDIDDWVNSCTGCEVSWNRLHDCPSCGPALWLLGTPDVRVVGNEIWGNTFFATSTPSQLHLQGAPAPVIQNNLVYGNGGDALGLHGCPSSSKCGAQTSSPALVINNTFWGNALVSVDNDTAEIAIRSGADGATFRNNLLGFGRGPAFYSDGTTFTSSDYNGFFPLGDAGYALLGGTAAADLQQWRALGYDRNGAEADPLFVSDADFHLRSPAGWFDPDGDLRGDALTSPFLDFGDPATPIGAQRTPNQGRVNLGAYGGTGEASLTPVKLAGISGDGQVADAGAPVAQPLAVSVRFAENGLGAAGVAVAFAVISGDGRVAPAETVTDAAGTATAQLTLGASASTTVLASLPRALGAGEVTFTATALVTPPPDAGPDAGADAGALGPLDVSCNCASGGRPAVLALLLLAAAFLRRRRPRQGDGDP
ncbi:MAG TPA: right-handed parallel beta-helix repeat-containing protein [Myxococcales bacterium]|nr:right-handed parallel beta-helix repeat-containing protein [Myxococcales bacterium]